MEAAVSVVIFLVIAVVTATLESTSALVVVVVVLVVDIVDVVVGVEGAMGTWAHASWEHLCPSHRGERTLGRYDGLGSQARTMRPWWLAPDGQAALATTSSVHRVPKLATQALASEP